MTKKQITHLNKLNLPITKYFGNFLYYNYRMRGKMKKYRLVLEGNF